MVSQPYPFVHVPPPPPKGLGLDLEKPNVPGTSSYKDLLACRLAEIVVLRGR